MRVLGTPVIPVPHQHGNHEVQSNQQLAVNTVFDLLERSQQFVDQLLLYVENRGPASSFTSSIDRKKRKRASPFVHGNDKHFSEHLAMPGTPTQDLLPLLKGELLHHQLQGVRWLASLYSSGRNGILSDELPGDRRAQVIGLLSYLNSMGVPGPFLIVGRTQDCLAAWAADMQRLLPQQPAHVYNASLGSAETIHHLCSPAGSAHGGAPLILVTFQELISEQKQLARYNYKYLVVDTSSNQEQQQQQPSHHHHHHHHHRHHQGHQHSSHHSSHSYSTSDKPTQKALESLTGLSASCKLLLTGSHPVKGFGIEHLWPLVDLVLPELAAHLHDAMRKLQTTMDPGPSSNAHQEELVAAVTARMRVMLDKFVLSRTAEELDVGRSRRTTEVNLYDYFNSADS